MDRHGLLARIATETIMPTLASLKALVARWQAYRLTIQELAQLSDRELDDIGLHRCDIPAVARRACDRLTADPAPHAVRRPRHALA
jgi:uncharacterized protein YjiS (DUF1127 family)